MAKIVAVAKRDPAPLLVVAARSAFWVMCLTLLRHIASMQGLGAMKGCSLFKVLFSLVEHILALHDDHQQVFHILSQRFRNVPEDDFQALLDCDAGLDVLDKEDAKEVSSGLIRFPLSYRGS